MYAKVFVAGTFDRLHKGHEFLLTNAFEVGEHVVIGLTSDAYVRKYKSKILNPKSETNSKFKILNSKVEIHSFEKRKRDVLDWLNEHGKQSRVTIVPIDDPYEPLASDPLAGGDTALLVTPDNKKRGEEINALRKTRGLAALTIIEIPMIAAADARPISSTRVRAKEIDRSGRLTMPDNLRPELQKALGKVLVGDAINQSIARLGKQTSITVGDMSTKTLLDAGVTPTLSIIDGKVGRKPFHETLKSLQLQKVKPFSLKAVKSGPGYISREAIKTIRSCLASDTGLPAQAGNQRIEEHQVICVEGEEDLLVLPVVQYAPVGSVVYYGQPRIASVRGKPSGLVEINVTEEKKREVAVLLAEFLS